MSRCASRKEKVGEKSPVWEKTNRNSRLRTLKKKVWSEHQTDREKAGKKRGKGKASYGFEGFVTASLGGNNWEIQKGGCLGGEKVKINARQEKSGGKTEQTEVEQRMGPDQGENKKKDPLGRTVGSHSFRRNGFGKVCFREGCA